MGYKTIRQANDLIANLPAYVGKLKGAESWIAEAKFIRAYVYFAMVNAMAVYLFWKPRRK